MTLGAKSKKVVMYQKEDRYKSNENNKKLLRVKAKLVFMWSKYDFILNNYYRAVQILHLFFKQYCYATNAVIYEICSQYVQCICIIFTL